MQITMNQILNFTIFYEAVKSQKLPIKTAYRLTKLAKAIEEEITFYREKIQSIIKEYGEVDENGQPIPTEDGNGVKLRPGTEMECNSAIQELYTMEITLPDITFDIEEFDNVELTTEEFTAILPFIKED